MCRVSKVLLIYVASSVSGNAAVVGMKLGKFDSKENGDLISRILQKIFHVLQLYCNLT